MSEPTAVAPSPLAPEMRQILEQRLAARRAVERAERAEKRKDHALVAAVMQAPDVAGTTDQLHDDVQRAGLLVRRAYAALLCEPATLQRARELLQGAENAAQLVKLFGGIRELIAEAGEKGASGGGSIGSLNIVNHVPRPGKD